MDPADLSVTFPTRGVIRLQSRSLFADIRHPTCRQFLERVARVPEIQEVAIRAGHIPHAELRFCARTSRLEPVVERLIAALRQAANPADELAGDRPRLAGWEIRLDRPGRLRLKNRALYRRSALRESIDRALSRVLGIENFHISTFWCTVQVDYDPAHLDARDVIEIVESALRHDDRPGPLDRPDWHLRLSTATLPIAAAAQFAVPALLPLAATLYAAASIPALREAHRALVRERRLGTEVLDSAVVLGCLGTMAIFPGALLGWSLGFGRAMVGRTRDDARKLLLDGFGKQPRQARLDRDGVTVDVPTDRLRPGDLIVVGAGEVVPVDGQIVRGKAMIDLGPLSGGSAMAGKGVGDRVFAATLAVDGRVHVRVEAAGEGTASARIGRILRQSAESGPSPRSGGETLAARAVLPTVAIGAIGLATIGPAGALAVLNRDLGTGLRMASPLTMLGALALCAHKGIVVKDIQAFERMGEVDTILLDLSALPAVDASNLAEIVENLRRFGIDPIAILPGEFEATEREHARSLGIDRTFVGPRPADRTGIVEALQAEGRTVCLIGDGLLDAIAMKRAHLAISIRGAPTIDEDAAPVILLEGSLARLPEFCEIARDLERHLRRGWSMIVVPNVACVAGVFTMGLGILASVVINNLAAMAALVHGVLPLRAVAQLEAERLHRLEIHQERAVRRLSDGPILDGEPPVGLDSGLADLASPVGAIYHNNNDEDDLCLGAPSPASPGPISSASPCRPRYPDAPITVEDSHVR